MRTIFTQEEIALLEKNNYTHLVSKSMLKFTDDFKDDFWRLYLTDLPVKEIFRMLGYDPEVIGTKRIDGFVYNLRKARLTDEQRIGSISRASKVRRPPADVNYSEMKSKEAIKAMEIELTYLRQEVDFLKKLYSLIPPGNRENEIDITNCSTFDEVKAIMDDWIDYYNNERYQWGLAKLAPNEYYNYITTGIYPIK